MLEIGKMILYTIKEALKTYKYPFFSLFGKADSIDTKMAALFSALKRAINNNVDKENIDVSDFLTRRYEGKPSLQEVYNHIKNKSDKSLLEQVIAPHNEKTNRDNLIHLICQAGAFGLSSDPDVRRARSERALMTLNNPESRATLLTGNPDGVRESLTSIGIVGGSAAIKLILQTPELRARLVVGNADRVSENLSHLAICDDSAFAFTFILNDTELQRGLLFSRRILLFNPYVSDEIRGRLQAIALFGNNTVPLIIGNSEARARWLDGPPRVVRDNLHQAAGRSSSAVIAILTNPESRKIALLEFPNDSIYDRVDITLREYAARYPEVAAFISSDKELLAKVLVDITPDLTKLTAEKIMKERDVVKSDSMFASSSTLKKKQTDESKWTTLLDEWIKLSENKASDEAKEPVEIKLATLSAKCPFSLPMKYIKADGTEESILKYAKEGSFLHNELTARLNSPKQGPEGRRLVR